MFTGVTLFGRMAQSFRVPNVDERVGASPVLTITDFDLRTQKSHDYEGGVRLRFGPFDVQSSVYDMHLTDELHFNPGHRSQHQSRSDAPHRRRDDRELAA